MCISCGCGKPADDMGNADTITLDTLEKAAKASDITVEEVVSNVGDYVSSARAGADSPR